MNPGPQATIAHQLLGTWEAGNLANRAQDRHRGDHPCAGKLEQEGNAGAPGVTDRLLSQFALDIRNVTINMENGGQIMLHPQALDGCKREGGPPGSTLNRKHITSG